MIFLSVVLVGCGDDSALDTDLISAPTDTIQLVEELRIGNDESPGAPLFKGIGSVTADDRGQLYVTDWMDYVVWVISPAGEVVRTIGSKGDGPGEFSTSPGSTTIDGDSVTIVWHNRLSVFDRDSGDYRTQYQFPNTGHQVTYGILARNGDDFIVKTFNSASGLVDDTDYLMRYRLDGSSAEKVLSVASSETIRDANGSVTTRGFLKRSSCTATDGRIYCGFNDLLQFTEVSFAGDSLRTFGVDFEPLPMTTSEHTKYEDEFANTSFAPNLRLPDTWPAYYAATGDDEGRLWVSVRSERIRTKTDFWVIDPEEMSSKMATVDGEVFPNAILDGKLYGSHTDSEGNRTVVRYAIVK